MSDDAELLGELRYFPGGVPRCNGCAHRPACRVGIDSQRILEGDRMEAVVHCPAENEAGPGVAHGGWTATVLDECLGHLAVHLGGAPVTGTLTVVYKKPVPIERPLRLTAWIEGVEGRRWRIAGELLLGGTDTLLAAANGVWIERRPNHFTSFNAWMLGQS